MVLGGIRKVFVRLELREIFLIERKLMELVVLEKILDRLLS